MAKDEFIDGHVSLKQCNRAVETLHAYETKRQQKLQETELLPGKEPNIWLNVTVKTIPPGHRVKPVKVPVAYPLVDPRTTPICLITKDPQREYKDLLESHNIKFISRVVGIEKLKGKFKPYEARRALLKENGMFLADERVVPLLPKLLGKKWFDAKKQPIPVCLKRKDLKGELERSISSTYMNQNQGTCTSVKIATLSHKPSQVLANLQKALPTIVANIKDGWENIQSLQIKTNASVSLPIWTCSLDASEEGRWHNLEATDADEVEEGSEEEAGKAKNGKNGRKRESSSDEGSEDVPRKRAKKTKDADTPSTAKSSKVTAKAESPKAMPGPSTKGKIKSKSDAHEPVRKSKQSFTVPPQSGPVKQKNSAANLKSSTKVADAMPAPTKSKSSLTKASNPDSPAVSDNVNPSALATAKELKSKREGKPLEKKKEKVVKQKSGKSAKNTLLGKKAAQS